MPSWISDIYRNRLYKATFFPTVTFHMFLGAPLNFNKNYILTLLCHFFISPVRFNLQELPGMMNGWSQLNLNALKNLGSSEFGSILLDSYFLFLMYNLPPAGAWNMFSMFHSNSCRQDVTRGDTGWIGLGSQPPAVLVSHPVSLLPSSAQLPCRAHSNGICLSLWGISSATRNIG